VRVLHPHSRKTLTKLDDEARTNAPSLSAMLGLKIWNHPQAHGRQPSGSRGGLRTSTLLSKAIEPVTAIAMARSAIST
jgi:hypothetical protein